MLDEPIKPAARGGVFQDRAPWWGGDLQTLRNVVMRRNKPLPGRASSVEFETADGSGDRLKATLSEPDAPDPRAPLIVLMHGLTGCEDSDYMRASARFHLARGRMVLRLNLRGAGPGRSLAKNYYHAGCAPDVQSVLEGLDPPLTGNGVFLIGYSLGGNVLLNWLGRADHPAFVIGAATVSAPIEPAQACERILQPRNALYHHFLIQRMKRDVLSSCVLSSQERRSVADTRSVFEFDDRWVAPRNGFDGALDYYTRTAGAQFVPAIAIPTLMIHAANDPWIPPGPYFRAREHGNPNVDIFLARSGGHLGFHERGEREPWHDRMIDSFIQGIAGPA
ncbi:YheT family hydrolase [Methyloceanibacter caenitepidi]|uniref:Hydrolase, alpha/beta fold family n=1 Tax=Methyloceanibacter caenitepidi TaxID=1384459 RepID=A0A0A8K8Z5_9HYPH|nr:alpha/beta fold hydrolase [Methyloceanibacter caenitepidi]BAQ18484.1 hydrolase, alpha/beta fold family [Methyloceanibacter caenitepidi]